MAVHRIFGNSECTNLPTCKCQPIWLEDEHKELGGTWIHEPVKYASLTEDKRVVIALLQRGENSGLGA